MARAKKQMSGMTEGFWDLLNQIRARGQAVVFDTQGEYVEYFYREGKDVSLKPLERQQGEGRE